MNLFDKNENPGIAGEDHSELLRQLHADFHKVGLVLERIAQETLHNRVSRYPVIVAHAGSVGLGVPVIPRDEYELHWYYNASTLEELVRKAVLSGEKLADFKRAYTDPTQRACILLADPQYFNFVFIPYSVLDAPMG
ncbi:MAG: hypothetical protein KF690_04225 [Bacteroidetes bacterium]|nr:hypothetical protein [Bacteroidota bacterium]